MNDCTVIINTVNEVPERLQAAIHSYKTQVGADVHILISTVEGDPSSELPHEIVISPKGIYQQLNNAVKHIYTDWWCYASGNDIAHTNKIQSEIMRCKNQRAKVCYSDFNMGTPSGGFRRMIFPEYNYDTHVKGNFVNDCSMIHHSLLKYMPFQFEKWGNLSHWDFWLRVYEAEGNVFCHNPYPTWDYIQHEDSKHIMRSKNPKEVHEMNELVKKLQHEHRTKRWLL